MKRFVTMCAAIGAGFVMTSFALATEPQLASPAAPHRPDSRSRRPDERLLRRRRCEETGRQRWRTPFRTKRRRLRICALRIELVRQRSVFVRQRSRRLRLNLRLRLHRLVRPWTWINCWPFCCCCKPGDPCTLQKHLTPCCTDMTYGGFVELGYHSQNTGLSVDDGDQLDTNDTPGDVQSEPGLFLRREKGQDR